MLAVFVVCLVVLTQTRFGRYVFAIGSNPEVTRLTEPVPNRSLRGGGVCDKRSPGRVGGLILTGRLAAADPNAATGYELDVIAAVVIGGTSLFGGAVGFRHAYWSLDHRGGWQWHGATERKPLLDAGRQRCNHPDRRTAR